MKFFNLIVGFTQVGCDLIGFNRLGNNIAFHDRLRNQPYPGFNFAYWTKMSPSEKLTLMKLQVLRNQKGARRQKNNRQENRRKLFLNHYHVLSGM